jgi:hypothetical protein
MSLADMPSAEMLKPAFELGIERMLASSGTRSMKSREKLACGDAAL